MAFAEMLCEAGANISALTGRNLNGKKSSRHPSTLIVKKQYIAALLPEAPRVQQIPETAIQHQFFCATNIHHCISEPNRVRERERTNRASSEGTGRCNPEWKFSKKEKRSEISQKCTKDSARRFAGDGRFGICRGDPSKCGENLLEFIRGRRSSEHIRSRIVIPLENATMVQADLVRIDMMQYRSHDCHLCRHGLPTEA
jgi:hypothetical protein